MLGVTLDSVVGLIVVVDVFFTMVVGVPVYLVVGVADVVGVVGVAGVVGLVVVVVVVAVIVVLFLKTHVSFDTQISFLFCSTPSVNFHSCESERKFNLRTLRSLLSVLFY